MPNMKSLSLTVIANVKVDNRQQTDRQTDKQTGQKQYAPDHSIRGHENNVTCISLHYNCVLSVSLDIIQIRVTCTSHF